MDNLKEFQKSVGVSFTNEALLREALTHRSYLNEHKRKDVSHNERLEFLGDAVLELAVTRKLFDAYPESPEGELTAYRAALVNTVSLAETGDALAINEYILLSKGEAKDTGRARQYIIANAVEAIIGAIYLDQGYDAAEAFIARNFYGKLEVIIEKRLWQDAKSYFQEKAQEHTGLTPTYESVAEEGPDHDKVFTIAVFVGEEKVAEGTGVSKQEAQTNAAENALIQKGWR